MKKFYILFQNTQFILVVLLLALFFCPCNSFAAREYTPVDELGKPSPSSTVTRRTSSPARSSSASTGTSRAKSTGNNWKTPSGNFKLFGTVEIQRPLSTLPGWLDVLKRNQADPIFQAARQLNRTSTWQQLQAKAAGQSELEQLRLINSFWNTWPYKEDKANWGKEDYWAIPAQFLKKSGDCEDYAIAKYFTLKELGIDPQKMRIVVLRDTIRRLAHAVLAVYLDDDVYVLDNLSNVVLSHRRLPNYSPQYSVNEYGRWAHMKPKS